jgi:hypothetical protein
LGAIEPAHRVLRFAFLSMMLPRVLGPFPCTLRATLAQQQREASQRQAKEKAGRAAVSMMKMMRATKTNAKK